jgi:NADH-quinone oxidoreductase subunit J
MILKEHKSKSKTKWTIIIVIHLLGLLALLYLVLLVLSYILPGIVDVLLNLWLHSFYIVLPIVIISSSLFVIVLPNPMHALLALILLFISSAVFLLSIKIKFLAFMYLIIYIGAIAILFLFVIMLFNLRTLKKSDVKIKEFSFINITFKIFFIALVKIAITFAISSWTLVEFNSNIENYAHWSKFDLAYFLKYVNLDIFIFSKLFYTQHAWMFLIVTLILLAAMIGAIVLALTVQKTTTDVMPGSIQQC